MYRFIGGSFLNVGLSVFLGLLEGDMAMANCLGIDDVRYKGGVTVAYDAGPVETFRGGGLVDLRIGAEGATQETYKLVAGLYIQKRTVFGESSDSSVTRRDTEYLYVGGVSALPSPAPEISFRTKVTLLIGGWKETKQQVHQWSFGPRRPVVIGSCTYFGFDAQLSVDEGQKIENYIYLDELGISVYIGDATEDGLLRSPVQIVRARSIG